MTNIHQYSHSLLPQNTPNLLSCITSMLPISRSTSLINSAPGGILCTCCPKPSPFSHQNPLFLYHIFAHCCKDLPFIIRFLNHSSLRYLLSQVFSNHSTELWFCPSSCPHCQPWHTPPQGGSTGSNTHPLVVIETLSAKKYRDFNRDTLFSGVHSRQTYVPKTSLQNLLFW